MRRGRVFAQRATLKLNRKQNPLEELAAAERDENQAIRLDPSYGEAYLRRARILGARGAYQSEKGGDGRPDLLAAEADFTRAMDLGSTTVEVWFQRADARFALGEWKKAADDYEHGLRLAPSRERVMRPRLDECRRRMAQK